MGCELTDISLEQAADEWISIAPIESRETEYWAFIAGATWSANRWHKVSELVPSDGELVLVHHGHRGLTLAHYSEPYNQWMIEGGLFDCDSVSFWAPVSLPPNAASK